mgnify:CR=1 FL=1
MYDKLVDFEHKEEDLLHLHIMPNHIIILTGNLITKFFLCLSFKRLSKHLKRLPHPNR